jgi:4-amino-4-deoxy-L-arabinose transferase-like glycosyltransferase
MKVPFSFAPIAILLVTLIAFGARLAYLLNSHPFIDEFTTVLAAKAILQRGLPILPSGLFYEHGMAFSYLAAPFVALANTQSLILLARLPSLLIGTATVPFLYWIGRRWFSPWVGLAAAALLALSPEGMVWGGRARMYGLAQCLVLLLVFLAYEGSIGSGRPRLRWFALLALLAALLTQFAVMLYIPPLVAGVGVVVWLSGSATGVKSTWRIWLWQGLGLAAVVLIGVLVKRLGQPIGMAPLTSDTTTNPLIELWNTIAYQTGLVLDGPNTVEFLARQFGVPHHLWLAVIIVLGLLVFGVIVLSRFRSQSIKSLLQNQSWPYIFLWLVFGLVILEMVTLLETFRRNPRYVVIGLPLFYLLVGGSLWYWFKLPGLFPQSRSGRPGSRVMATVTIWLVAGLLLLLQLRGLWVAGTIAYRTPEPPYDEAFQYVAGHRQPGDVVLTMNTSAALLYLNQVDYFAIQEDAGQFLLNLQTGPVDRWAGVPWVSTTAQFNRIANENGQVWFVVDEQRLTTFGFYRGDWISMLNSQMEQVWANDGALVYRTRPDRPNIPDAPAIQTEAQFGDVIQLEGYELNTDASPPQLTLFWKSLADMDADYITFIHLRDEANETAAQWDGPIAGGLYPTGQWLPGDTLVNPVTLTLPDTLQPGQYSLALGLYRLDTLERLPLAGDSSSENALILGPIMLP